MLCPNCSSPYWSRYGHEGLFECNSCKSKYTVSEMVVTGEYYVYRFINDTWGGVPFYVGKGKENRFKQLKGRNKHILSICENTDWHPEIIRYCSTEKEALELEISIKKEYISLGYPLIDKEPFKSNPLSQREGIERARAMGKYIGGKKKEIPVEFTELYRKWGSRDITKSEFARSLGISRPTLDNWIKQYKAPLPN